MTNRYISDIIEEQDLLALSPNASVQEACRCMCERHFGAVVVTDATRHLLGIFTGRDAVRMLGAEGDAAHTRLSRVMTRDLVTITSDAHALDALRLMNDGGFRHLPVITDGEVVGIVTRSDFEGLELDRFEEETTLWERIA